MIIVSLKVINTFVWQWINNLFFFEFSINLSVETDHWLTKRITTLNESFHDFTSGWLKLFSFTYGKLLIVQYFYRLWKYHKEWNLYIAEYSNQLSIADNFNSIYFSHVIIINISLLIAWIPRQYLFNRLGTDSSESYSYAAYLLATRIFKPQNRDHIRSSKRDTPTCQQLLRCR